MEELATARAAAPHDDGLGEIGAGGTRRRDLLGAAGLAAAGLAAGALGAAAAGAQGPSPTRRGRMADGTEPLPRLGPGLKLGGLWGALPVAEYAASLPATSEKSFEQRTLVTRPQGGVRLMRLYKATPPHYHTKSDAVIYVLAGRGRYQVADLAQPLDAGPGTLLYWGAGTPHCCVQVLQGPHDLLIFDVGVRDVNDIIFLDPRNEGAFLGSD